MTCRQSKISPPIICPYCFLVALINSSICLYFSQVHDNHFYTGLTLRAMSRDMFLPSSAVAESKEQSSDGKGRPKLYDEKIEYL